MSEVREGYKMTELGEIPNEWGINALDDLVIKITDGAHRTPTYTENGIPFLRVTDIQSKSIDWNKTKYISKEEHEELIKRCHPEKGDLLLSKNGTIGILKQIDWENEFSIFVSLCLIKLKKTDSLIDAKFLLHYLNSEVAQKQFKDSSKQGTVTNLHLTEIKKCKVPVLNLEEQQKIASFLTTVDEQIDETKQLIVKTKELKKGLMQQLLTKGIGHKEFKQTELGEIPSEWQVLKLNNIAEVIMGQSPNSNSYNELKIGLPFYQGKSEFGKRYPTPVKWCSEPTKIAEKNDILISVRAPVGEVNICQETSCIGRGLGAIRATKESSNLFLYYSLQLAKEALNKMSQGSTFTAINGAELKNVPLAVPTKVEQQKIASILSTVDEQIEVYEQEKAKYEELKKGLMQKLLNGQIRVKI